MHLFSFRKLFFDFLDIQTFAEWLMIKWYDTIHALHKAKHQSQSKIMQPYSSIWHQRHLTKSSGRSESSWHCRQCALKGLPIPPWQLIQAKVYPSATCTHLAACTRHRGGPDHENTITELHLVVSPQKSLETHINILIHELRYSKYTFKIHLQNRQEKLNCPYKLIPAPTGVGDK